MESLEVLRARVEVLLFDVDDTVTTDGRVEPVAIEALEALRAAGIRTVAVTGRPLGWAEVIAWTWPVDLAVGENGAGWMWRHGRHFVTRYFEDEPTRVAQRVALDAIAREIGRELPALPHAGDQALRRCDVAWDVGETWHAPEEDVARATALIRAAGMRAPRSSVHLHAVPGHWDKARGAVRALADRFGLGPEEARRSCAFVGDSGNDAEAFAFFDTSVGVANVREHLSRIPTPPRYVTPSPRGRGFAELAQRLITHARGIDG
ncbi:MAG: HAD-IIB family hydrolase [Sandaracinus sp.]